MYELFINGIIGCALGLLAIIGLNVLIGRSLKKNEELTKAEDISSGEVYCDFFPDVNTIGDCREKKKRHSRVCVNCYAHSASTAYNIDESKQKLI